MKSKTSSFEKSRLRKDYIFDRVVRVFGLLVLATFATLIFHILYNAAPLLFSAHINDKGSINLSDIGQANVSHLGIREIQGKWLSLSAQDCTLQLSSLVKSDIVESPGKKFAPDCSKEIIGVFGEHQTFITKMKADRLVEIHQLIDENTLFLFTSFTLPPSFEVKEQEKWQVHLHENIITIVQYEQSRTTLLRYVVGSLLAPELLSFEGNAKIYPVANNQQFLSVGKAQVKVFDAQANVIQSIDMLDDIVASSLSPSHFDLALVQQTKNQKNDSSQYYLQKLSFVNENGIFRLHRQYQTDLALDDFDKKMSQGFLPETFISLYDLQHNAIFLISSNGFAWIVNKVSGELQSVHQFPPNVLGGSYGNTQLFLQYSDSIKSFQVENLQGLVSSQVLFGKNYYTAYDLPQYIWQTSISNEVQSPKYSVVPLIMGSLKAAILALLVAVPLALGAAIYTAYFATKGVRNAIKPSIEMLEAIPSVIIGFIAAVWLAPFAEQYLVAIFTVVVMLPVIVVVIALIHNVLGQKLGDAITTSWPIVINSGLLLCAVVFVFSLSSAFVDYLNSMTDSALLAPLSNLSLSKTAIVVALALGIAITPTIYTLIDDALYEVPEGVKQASFALGATQIQTLVRVVLVIAFPSIISAVMLGFGRAFGETMIVLMVTGNTPIANWDLLSGLRTLTSNLAIELQEAQLDSTLYHVLFLTAAILFAFTFVINTVAAVLKRRMYKTGT